MSKLSGGIVEDWEISVESQLNPTTHPDVMKKIELAFFLGAGSALQRIVHALADNDHKTVRELHGEILIRLKTLNNGLDAVAGISSQFH